MGEREGQEDEARGKEEPGACTVHSILLRRLKFVEGERENKSGGIEKLNYKQINLRAQHRQQSGRENATCDKRTRDRRAKKRV